MSLPLIILLLVLIVFIICFIYIEPVISKHKIKNNENLKIENGALVLKADENFERNLRNRVQVLPSQKSVPEPEINLEV